MPCASLHYASRLSLGVRRVDIIKGEAMGTILTIIVVVALIGGAIGFFSSGGKTQDAAAGAVGGAMMAGGCIFQLLIAGAMALAGLWLLSLIF